MTRKTSTTVAPIKIVAYEHHNPMYTSPVGLDGTCIVCGKEHPEDRRFYAVMKKSDRKYLLLGPYLTHAEADNNVARGTELAREADPRVYRYEFGVSEYDDSYEPTAIFGK
ncbi:MAG: hypothetical protein ABI670_03490 [Chloroflexota bacterium]